MNFACDGERVDGGSGTECQFEIRRNIPLGNVLDTFPELEAVSCAVLEFGFGCDEHLVALDGEFNVFSSGRTDNDLFPRGLQLYVFVEGEEDGITMEISVVRPWYGREKFWWPFILRTAGWCLDIRTADQAGEGDQDDKLTDELHFLVTRKMRLEYRLSILAFQFDLNPIHVALIIPASPREPLRYRSLRRLT